jgi:hypothetical protein
LDINLPGGGTPGQFLKIASIGPQVLSWANTVSVVSGGPNATVGKTPTLGTTGVLVNTTAVATNSIILVTSSTAGGAVPIIPNFGSLIVGDIVNGVSFRIYSTNALQVGYEYNWAIVA